MMVRDFEVGERVEFWAGAYGSPVSEKTPGGWLAAGEVIRLDAYDGTLLVEMSYGGSFWFDQPSARIAGRDYYFYNPSCLRRVDPSQEPTAEVKLLEAQIENLRKAWPHQENCGSGKCYSCSALLGKRHIYGCLISTKRVVAVNQMSPRSVIVDDCDTCDHNRIENLEKALKVEPGDCGPCDCNRLEKLEKALRGEG